MTHRKSYLFFFFLVSSIIFCQAQYLKKDNLDRFQLFLDNGIERVDLSETQSCSKSFFTRGMPRLVIVKKGESRVKLNLVLAFKVFLYEDIMGKPPGYFSMKSSAFNYECIREIIAAPKHSRIMIGEIEMDIPEKALNPYSQRTAAFFVHIE